VVRDGKLKFGASADPAIFAMGSSGGVVEGTIASGQTLWVRGSGTFSHANVSTGAGGLASAGVIRLESVDGGWESNLSGSVTNEATGVLEVNAGSGGPRTFNGTLTNRGLVSVKTAFAVTGSGLLNAEGGRLQGTGTLTHSGAAVTNAGRIGPGHSPGTLTLSGSVAQTATGSLDVEIGGRSAGSQHDQLRVSGTAGLDGALNVVLAGGFDPAIGDTFEVLTYGARSGAFATVNGSSIGPGKRFSLAYGPGKAVLTVVAE
jgi:hypothetical protein